jgi:hypothetical protein
MSSMNVASVSHAAPVLAPKAVAAPRDADGDRDGSAPAAAAAAAKPPALAPAGQPGSVLHVVA